MLMYKYWGCTVFLVVMLFFFAKYPMISLCKFVIAAMISKVLLKIATTIATLLRAVNTKIKLLIIPAKPQK